MHASDCTFAVDCPNEAERLRLDWRAWRRRKDTAEVLLEIQADLDAALIVLVAWEPCVLAWCQRFPQLAQPVVVEAHKRVEPLLAARKALNQ